MCYICEARGTVGENYKATQKEIATARRQLGRVPPDEAQHFWGVGKDWTKAPTKRLWSNADLKEYKKEWRREHLI